jgi:hypothetical protein
LQDIALPASCGPTRAVAEVLIKVGALLYPGCCTAVPTSHCPVDHIKAALTLIQPQFVVGRACRVGEIDGAPFDVKYPIGRSAGDRDKDAACPARVTRTASVCIRALVVPIREDSVVVTGPRQTHVGERRITSRKLGIAVRRHCNAVEGLVVDRVGEWQ